MLILSTDTAMSKRTLRVHERKDGVSYKLLLESRARTSTIMFEAGAIAELSKCLLIFQSIVSHPLFLHLLGTRFFLIYCISCLFMLA